MSSIWTNWFTYVLIIIAVVSLALYVEERHRRIAAEKSNKDLSKKLEELEIAHVADRKDRAWILKEHFDNSVFSAIYDLLKAGDKKELPVEQVNFFLRSLIPLCGADEASKQKLTQAESLLIEVAADHSWCKNPVLRHYVEGSFHVLTLKWDGLRYAFPLEFSAF